MNKDFWLSRWQKNMIGFHQSETSPALTKYIDQLPIAPGDTVLLPLCGKSHDLEWLHQQDYKVIGVEISPIATRDFFVEQNRQAHIASNGNFNSYRSEGIEILCGDYFALGPEQLPEISAVFDRAALIALPEEMRSKYVSKIADLISHGTPVLLVTLEYPPEEMTGPPFSITEQNVRDLYSGSFSINVLDQRDVLAQEAKFREQGLSRLVERVYLLERL